MFQTLFNSFNEIATLTLLLLFLHWLRRTIGVIPMYLVVSFVFVLGEIVLLPSLHSFFISGNTQGTLGYGLILLPVALMYLVVYEEEGTLEAHRFIFGMLMAVIGFIYILLLVTGQFQLEDSSNIPRMIEIIANPKGFHYPMLFMTFMHLTAFLVMPISYQYLRNWKCPTGICIPIHLLFFIFVNRFTILLLSSQKKLPQMNVQALLSWGICMLVMCAMAQIYVWVTGSKNEGRRPFGIISNLIEHLQSASKMRQTVEEWAGRYHIVFDNSLEMIFLVNSRGEVINANHAAVKLLGSHLNATGFPLPGIIFSENEPFNWNEAWSQIWQLRTTTEPVASFNNMLLDASGEKYNIDFSMFPVHFNDHNLAVIIMRNTTEQHREEKERKRLEEQLVYSQRMEAVGVLAGGIAHDFNNLLLSIQSSSELLRQHAKAQEGISLLNNIDNASKRAADLITQLLGFARKGKYQLITMDMETVVQKAASLFKVGLKEIEFKVICEPEPMMVSGDETQLQQVLLNLLINAKDAILAGNNETKRIILRLNRASEDMRAWKNRPQNTGAPSDYVNIKLKDTGIGMDENTLDHIFEPFFTTKGTKGTGLGMSMVYGCIQHHHGWIDIDSKPNEGCEINIFLPRYKKGMEEAHAEEG